MPSRNAAHWLVLGRVESNLCEVDASSVSVRCARARDGQLLLRGRLLVAFRYSDASSFTIFGERGDAVTSANEPTVSELPDFLVTWHTRPEMMDGRLLMKEGG